MPIWSGDNSESRLQGTRDRVSMRVDVDRGAVWGKSGMERILQISMHRLCQPGEMGKGRCSILKASQGIVR
jgi:hypothetical protein